ncbi:MAG: precorrin-4 C(11)-methyltransferase [Synergistaceae bacterium]|nr:precorrin-4 C(11)-methyltransferase [Synergistaceae bacterium]
MIYFIGAGPGAVDLITVRGAKILSEADRIIFAGSLVNPELVKTYAKDNCEIFDSAAMTLEEISEKLIEGHEKNLVTVRLHSGDPALYGAIREQIEFLDKNKIPFEIIPGVSSLFAASAALKTEFMIPEITQSLLISRVEGRTPAPDSKPSVVLFLSAGMIAKACDELISKNYLPKTPAALVYKASWPDEKIVKGTLETLPALAKEAGINKTALILAGDFLDKEIHTKSKLYDKNFSHGFRK